MLLNELVRTSAAVAGTRARRAKIAEIAALLATVPADEVPVAVAFLSGELRQRQIGVGYAALGDLTRPGDLTWPSGQSHRSLPPEPPADRSPTAAGPQHPTVSGTAARTVSGRSGPSADRSQPAAAWTISRTAEGWTAGRTGVETPPGAGRTGRSAAPAVPTLTLAETDAAFAAIGAITGQGAHSGRLGCSPRCWTARPMPNAHS